MSVHAFDRHAFDTAAFDTDPFDPARYTLQAAHVGPRIAADAAVTLQLGARATTRPRFTNVDLKVRGDD